MDLNTLTTQQREATLRLYALSTEAIFPATPRTSPAGRIVALRGGAGTGKSEVLIQLTKLLIGQKSARDEQAARKHARDEQAAQTNQAAHADGVRFTDDKHNTTESHVPKPVRAKSDATLMRAARRERDEREMAELEKFEVFFEED
jgi:hypothetical protein